MDKKYLKKFAQNLKKIRKSKGLTQDDLSATEGFSRSTIGMLETGRTDVTLSTLKLIAKALGVEPKDLLDFKD